MARSEGAVWHQWKGNVHGVSCHLHTCRPAGRLPRPPTTKHKPASCTALRACAAPAEGAAPEEGASLHLLADGEGGVQRHDVGVTQVRRHPRLKLVASELRIDLWPGRQGVAVRRSARCWAQWYVRGYTVHMMFTILLVRSDGQTPTCADMTWLAAQMVGTSSELRAKLPAAAGRGNAPTMLLPFGSEWEGLPQYGAVSIHRTG